MGVEQSKLNLAKDLIYVFCTPLALILAFVTCCWWDQRNRRKDRKEALHKAEEERKEALRKAEEERKKAEEEQKMADAEKIVALLSKDYDEVVETFSQLKKRLDDLEKNKIDTGSKIFTELDVLRYMCRGGNWDKFNRTQHVSVAVAQTSSHQPSTSQLFDNQPSTSQLFDNQPYTSQLLSDFQTSDHTRYGRKDVMSDVNKIMKFFKNFAFKLSALDKRCPDDIKDEFSGEMFEMGETICPFVSESRQKLIAKVLKYFGYNTSAEGDGQPAPRGGDAQPAPAIEMTANVNLIPYPGHDRMKRAIPYIDRFMYENGEMKCNLECQVSSIDTLVLPVVMEKISAEQKQKLLVKIEERWSGLSGDLLHRLRSLMFERSIAADDPFDEYVKSIVNSLRNSTGFLCERELHNIVRNCENLCERYNELPKDENTLKLLKCFDNKLTELIRSIS